MSSSFADQAPLSIGLLRQEYWSRLPFPSPGDLPNPGIEPSSLTPSALAGRFFSTTWEAQSCSIQNQKSTLTSHWSQKKKIHSNKDRLLLLNRYLFLDRTGVPPWKAERRLTCQAKRGLFCMTEPSREMWMKSSCYCTIYNRQDMETT